MEITNEEYLKLKNKEKALNIIIDAVKKNFFHLNHFFGEYRFEFMHSNYYITREDYFVLKKELEK